MELESVSPFYKWLTKQKRRDDPIGDLARDVLRDRSFPSQEASFDRIHGHLLFKRACAEAICALDEAWQEFTTKSKRRAPLTLKKRFEIFERDAFQCQLCGSDASEGAKLEIDHKIPIAKGGTNLISNLWTLCFSCNRGKGTKIIKLNR